MSLSRCLMLLSLLGSAAVPPTISQPCPNAIDYFDSIYGAKIRQLKKSDGHEHNIYYHRNPWNADASYLIGIQSDSLEMNWQIVLYDSNGCFLKTLFDLSQYDWRLVWDRNDPAILYTRKGSNFYRYNVNTGQSDLLKSFAPLVIVSSSQLSLNQAGDRILVITSDGTFRSYRLPDMGDERAFKPTFPASSNCVPDWEDIRYIGYQNLIAIKCASNLYGAFYHDDGTLYRESDNFPLGHSDFSPDGQWAYLKRVEGGPRGGLLAWEIHAVNLDGANDRILYSVPQPQAGKIRNLHISWPDRDNARFFVSFFPYVPVPPTYVAPLDEILQVNLDGTHRFLARTGTDAAVFWAQPLASPSADGKRISFNSNRSGTIDQFILFVNQGTTGIKDAVGFTGTFVLQQNYPNPFNPTTTIRFSLPQRERVTLKIFDVAGREVATLVDNELNTGEHRIAFDGRKLNSGIYFYSIAAGEFTQTRKAVLLK